MEEFNIDKCVMGVRTCLKDNSGRFGAIPASFRKELGIDRKGDYVLQKLMSNGILVVPYKPEESGFRVRIDTYGRMGRIPKLYREKLGIDYPNAEIEIILLKDGLFLRPVTA